MRGRKPKPTALKLLNGSAKHDPGRINADEPDVPAGRPDAPSWLGGHAIEGWNLFWDALDGMDASSPVWFAAAVLFADAWKGFRDNRDMCEKFKGEALVSSSGKGTEVKRLAYSAAMHKHKEYLKSMLSEFGMTASSKSRVSGMQSETVDDFEKYLKNRGGA